MTSLAHAILAFQNGGLSPNEFFALIDRVVASNRDSARLLQILNEEHTKYPLPPDVYAEVHRRIEHSGGSEHTASAEETRVQTRVDDDVSRPSLPSAGGTPGAASSAEPDRIKGVGDTVNGRFVLEECLGFGGMGTVYKALDLRKLEASDRNPYVAIKVLNVQFRGHPKSLIALQREAKKAQTLAHPNIVTVYDFDRDGSMVYLTMEYLSGRPLSYTLRAPGFAGMPYEKALHIVNGMARALAYAHERGFVHCDFKPANVFVTDSGQVKVIDFGIARVFQRPEQDTEATVFDAGVLGGLTPAYASPEMLEHREPDPRDDVYALACITYELLTGRHPFNRLPASQARSASLKPQRPGRLGLRQWRALRSALSFERETRTPSVARFLQEFNGDRSSALYVALAAVSVVLAMVLAAALYYYEFATGGGDEVAAPASPSPAPAPRVEAEAPPTLSLAAVKPALDDVPCSALTASVQGSALRVQGFVGKDYGTARLRDTLSAVPGVSDLGLDVREVNDDHCGVVTALAPYWVSNRQSANAAWIHTKAPNSELTEGDPLILDIKTPGFDSYVNVDYYVLNGGVVHLVPSPRAKDNQAPPNYAATIGSFGNWVISKPFGDEMVVLLVTPAPLFDAPRPEQESGPDYLRAMERQLARLRDKYGAERIAADFVQITTKPRQP